MARRRSLFKFRLPFFKFKFRINKKTFFNILGFIMGGFGIILLISFIQSGEVLRETNQHLVYYFGFLSICFPVIIIFIASHFFNSKKIQFIKPNITIGLILIFISIIGVLRSGHLGEIILDNLRQDLSIYGAIIILSITFIIGLILFLNTSVDTFVLFLAGSIKKIAAVFKKYIFREILGKDGKKKGVEVIDETRQEEFIQDKRPVISQSSPTSVHNQQTIQIKPLSKESQTSWVYPPLSLLSDSVQKEADRGDVRKNSDVIEKTLDSFGIRARVAEVNTGPTVTQYAIEIVMGTKLSRITALSNDLALALAATTGQVRIEAPIPGRSLVGIEIPNKKPEIVTLKRLLASDIFVKNPSALFMPLGLDVSGNPLAFDIDRMPHALIAGTTGSGKSVLLNAWICTFLLRTKPEDLRLILVDPKRVELTLYNGIPHLLTEVIVDPDKIISALKWTVSEMEGRYKLFSKHGVRNIEGYNSTAKEEKIPYIIIIIDELADLMVFAPGDAEELITRIAQMARATGIHLILATQRPSVDVITGLMKANIPTRIAFNVASMIDSRVVLDTPGAEKLLGRGDMLFLPPDQAKPRRIQGPLISEKEVQEVVKFLKNKTPVVHYTEEVTTQDISRLGRGGTVLVGEGKDSLFGKSIEIISQFGKASASLLQRRLSIGYARAAKILDQLEAEGYVGPAEGSKPREVLHRSPGQDDMNG